MPGADKLILAATLPLGEIFKLLKDIHDFLYFYYLNNVEYIYFCILMQKV